MGIIEPGDKLQWFVDNHIIVTEALITKVNDRSFCYRYLKSDIIQKEEDFDFYETEFTWLVTEFTDYMKRNSWCKIFKERKLEWD